MSVYEGCQAPLCRVFSYNKYLKKSYGVKFLESPRNQYGRQTVEAGNVMEFVLSPQKSVFEEQLLCLVEMLRNAVREEKEIHIPRALFDRFDEQVVSSRVRGKILLAALEKAAHTFERPPVFCSFARDYIELAWTAFRGGAARKQSIEGCFSISRAQDCIELLVDGTREESFSLQLTQEERDLWYVVGRKVIQLEEWLQFLEEGGEEIDLSESSLKR